MDCCACDVPSYMSSQVMKREVEEFAKYGTMESVTDRRDHDDSSRGPLTHRIFIDFQQLESFFY